MNEALVVGKYLIQKEPHADLLSRYAEALKKMDIRMDPFNQQLWDFSIKHSFILSFVDSGTAVLDPQGPIRRRLFVMLAILEASPHHAFFFLPVKRSPFYLLCIFYVSLQSVLRMFIGIAMIKALKVLWR